MNKLTTHTRIFAIVTGFLSGVLGAFALAAVLLVGLNWLTPPYIPPAGTGPSGFLLPRQLTVFGTVVAVVGLTVGYGAGLWLWALLVRRLQWLTWDQIGELIAPTRERDLDA